MFCLIKKKREFLGFLFVLLGGWVMCVVVFCSGGQSKRH